LPGLGLLGAGNFQTSHSIYWKLSGASHFRSANRCHCSRGKRDISLTPRGWSRTRSQKSFYGLHQQHTQWIPVRHSSIVASRHWPLLLPVLCSHSADSRQLYHGPIGLDYWFPEIFGCYSVPNLCASRVTLVASTGTPHRSALARPLSSMDSLPGAVEVLRG